ncbi:MAG: cytochrome c [Verrucomicrobiota bacterium]|nr:cytochrome c [Verrucomicrobiota bacterium]
MLRGFLLIFALAGIAILAIAGFRGEKSGRPPWEIFPDMVRQQKVRAQAPLGFFADDRGPRVPVAGTVPLGYEAPKPPLLAGPGSSPANAAPTQEHPQLNFGVAEDYYNTGRMETNWGTGIPIAVTPALMARGQQRFNINCSVCHGLNAAGNGVAKQYGLTTVASLQDARIRNMPDGEIFNTITHGKNTMMSYGGNVPVNDRWAIICYLRALQRGQNASSADVPPDELAQLDKPADKKPETTRK